MAQRFPLYDFLSTKSNNLKIDETEVRRVCAAINHILEDGNDDRLEYLEILYALILHSYFLEPKGKTKPGMIPYTGRTFENGRGIIYTFSHLPPKLQQIIVQYVNEIVNTV